MFVIRMANLPLHLLPFPPPTAITSIPYNTITKPSHDPGNLLHTSGSLHFKFTTFLCYSRLLCSPMYSRRVPLDLPNHGLKYVRSLALYWWTILLVAFFSVIYSFWFIIIFIRNNLAQSLNHSPKSWGNSIRPAHVIIGYHLVWESPPTPSPHKYLIFECISQPFSNLSFFSKRTPSCRDIIHHQSLYNPYPTYLQIFLNDIYITRGTPNLSP